MYVLALLTDRYSSKLSPAGPMTLIQCDAFLSSVDNWLAAEGHQLIKLTWALGLYKLAYVLPPGFPLLQVTSSTATARIACIAVMLLVV